MVKERWRSVVGYESLYHVSDQGRVLSIAKKALKKPTIDKAGRAFVLLWRNNKAKMMRVHRLVLFAFVGPPKKCQEACHNDGNPSNNALTNLRWDSASANQMDRARHGTSNRGERCAAAKITEAQARKIIADTRQQKEIAAEYGIRQSAVSRIKNGVRWAHLSGSKT